MPTLPNWLPRAVLAAGLSGAPALSAQAQTSRVSVATGGAQAESGGTWGALSADGRMVAFLSHSEDLVARDTLPAIRASAQRPDRAQKEKRPNKDEKKSNR